MSFVKPTAENITPGKTLTVVTGASSVSIALPTDDAGNVAWRYALVSTGTAYVRLGATGVAATSQDLLITTTPRYINARGIGATAVAYISTVVGSSVLSVAALNN